MQPYASLAFLFLALTLTGCLPSSCRRQESRALFPSDSLSRQRAEQVPADTLRLAWRSGGSAPPALAYPRTVRFGPQGRVYVSDVERGSIFVFGPEGRFIEEAVLDGTGVPYLAGFRGDTLVVFDPAALRLDFVLGGDVVRQLSLAAEPVRGALVYAAVTDSALYVKQVGEGIEGYLARFDEAGREAERFPLTAPYWRHAGLLRTWGDSLLSLSGFRPVVDVLPSPGAAALDTLALAGFDSPMLARSRAFIRGEVDAPPLLTPAAAAAGDRLFVLNLRPGWLQVDVFDRRGVLQRRLIQPEPGFQKNFFPQDLAARRLDAETYEIAVVYRDPEPRLDLYRIRLGDAEDLPMPQATATAPRDPH